jgi:hypothetical protein
MANSPAKIAALSFSLISTILITPFIVFVIKFERDNHNRTLINQFVSGNMLIGILWNLIMQTFTFYRYLIGPIDSTFVCSLDSILRNGFCISALLLFDAMIIARFTFLYFLKNPTALPDNFWKMFINAWIAVFCVISQSVFLMLPGKNPINYYMCVGKYPEEFHNQPVKVNYSVLIVSIFSIALHIIAAGIKLKIKDNLEARSMFSKTTNTIGIMSLMCVAFIIPTLINKKEPEELDTYPNYLLLYALHLYLTECNIIAIGTTYFYKSPALRKHLFSNLKALWKRFCSRETEVVVIT